MDAVPAPAGWGFRPGYNLAMDEGGLPVIEGIEKMSARQVMRTFITMLMDRPRLLDIVTGSMLQKHYPSAPRHACFVCIGYAKTGKMPQSMGRPVKNGFSKLP